MSIDSESKLIFVSIFILIVFGDIVTQSAVDSTKLRKNAQIVDSLKRFPHHLTIERDSTSRYENNENRLCGGSILNEQWILTSGFCIEGSDRLFLHFEKLFYHSYNGSFTIAVNKEEIYMYPTYYDDIALIHIPVELKFSDYLKPVKISSDAIGRLEGRLAVMPGFDIQRIPITTSTTTTTTTETPTTTTSVLSTTETETPTSEPSTTEEESSASTEATTKMDFITPGYTPSLPPNYFDQRNRLRSLDDSQNQLVYGMFRVLPNARCQENDSEFDEYKQICTEDWIVSTDNNPCWGYGNGLLVGWPENPELVGIYSVKLNDCYSSSPAVYTSIAEYLPWIQSVMNIPS